MLTIKYISCIKKFYLIHTIFLTENILRQERDCFTFIPLDKSGDSVCMKRKQNHSVFYAVRQSRVKNNIEGSNHILPIAMPCNENRSLFYLVQHTI